MSSSFRGLEKPLEDAVSSELCIVVATKQKTEKDKRGQTIFLTRDEKNTRVLFLLLTLRRFLLGRFDAAAFSKTKLLVFTIVPLLSLFEKKGRGAGSRLMLELLLPRTKKKIVTKVDFYF